VLIVKQKILRRRGHPHLNLERLHHDTATLAPSTISRKFICASIKTSRAHRLNLVSGTCRLDTPPT
jgi:hypothetical protein